jgi:glyoxylase-like metal-dependent hydrolase (beta-lactamase superfamily II)
VSKLDRSQAGVYRTKVGKIDLIAVSDGTVGLGLTKELIQNAKPGEVERLLARHFEKSPLDASVNAFLIKYEDKLVLVDAGSSELVGPTAGKLPQSLRAAGAPPENITDVFITHIHPDHTGGLMKGNTKVFSERDDPHQQKRGRLLAQQVDCSRRGRAAEDFLRPGRSEGQAIPGQRTAEDVRRRHGVLPRISLRACLRPHGRPDRLHS